MGAGEVGGLRAQVNEIGGHEGVWHVKFLQKQKPRVRMGLFWFAYQQMGDYTLIDHLLYAWYFLC